MENVNQSSEVQNNMEQWKILDFEGKEFCELKEDKQLHLKATKYTPERLLTKLETPNLLEEIAPLFEKFKELNEQAIALEKDWEEAEEKLKMENKIQRLKEHLIQTPAIGDFEPLLERLDQKQNHIHDLYNNHYQHRLQIVTKAEELVEQLKNPDSNQITHETVETVSSETQEESIRHPQNDTPEQSLDGAAAENNLQKEDRTDFKTLKEEWKSAPEIRKSDYNKLAGRFEKAENEYYNQKRKTFEEKEHAQMENLDHKMEICERAEKLSESTQWRNATESYQVLFEEWKKIGPVPSLEKNEELWQRFNKARNVFFERKKEHSESIKVEQQNNLILKTALVEKAEKLQDQKSWRETTQEFADLTEEWKSIGKVPFEKADELWNRFQAAKNVFFNAKRKNAQEFKSSLEENFQKKQVLVEKIEKLKNSTDWFETTNLMNALMTEWKTIGPVPKANGDELWEQFIAARKFFFLCKDKDRDKRKSKFQHQINNRLHQTTQFLDKIKAELEEEEASLADFKNSLQKTTGDKPKELELKQHLSHLIEKLEKRLPEKRKKVAEVTLQQEELIVKCKEVNDRIRKNNSNE